MIDIYWELTAISIAKYGWELRMPIYRAFRKFVEFYNCGGYMPYKYVDRLMARPYGGDVRLGFYECYMAVRKASHRVSGDRGMINFLTNDFGNTIKVSAYDALKGLAGEEAANDRGTLNLTDTDSYMVIAGNDEPMFITGGDNYGIAVTGTEAGFGDYDAETGLYSITLQVRNVITGTHYEKTVTSENKLYDSETIRFFVNDEITTMVDPGIVEIKFLNGADSSGKYGDIYTQYYLFGDTPAEGVVPTDENDYIYTSIPNDHSETLSYIGPSKIIGMPTTLNDEPLTVVGMTTFGYQDMEKVKIPDGVTKIE